MSCISNQTDQSTSYTQTRTDNEQAYDLIFGDIGCRLRNLEANTNDERFAELKENDTYFDSMIDRLNELNDETNERIDMLEERIDTLERGFERRLLKLEKLEAWYEMGHRVFAEKK